MVRPIPPEESFYPVQCEADQTPVNRVVVYGDRTYTTTVSSVVSSSASDQALEQQIHTGEIYEEENLVLTYDRPLTSGERWSSLLGPCPSIIRAGSRWIQSRPMLTMKTLIAGILLLILLIIVIRFC